MSKTVVYEVKVMFGDCDPAGIVFFPQYLVMLVLWEGDGITVSTIAVGDKADLTGMEDMATIGGGKRVRPLLLAANPELADHLLELALGRPLPPLERARAAHEGLRRERIAFVGR